MAATGGAGSGGIDGHRRRDRHGGLDRGRRRDGERRRRRERRRHGAAGTPATGAIADRLTVADVTVPAGVKAGVRNWRIWGASSLRVAPVFTVPLADCGTLVCYTSGTASAPTARARRPRPRPISSRRRIDLGAFVRGLAAEPDGGAFAALLWDDAADRIYVHRFMLTGDAGLDTELANSDNHPTDFGIGESRLEYGDGRYGAYYPRALRIRAARGRHAEVGRRRDRRATTHGWNWGCSHSMSELLRYHPQAASFLPVVRHRLLSRAPAAATSRRSIGGIYLDNRKQDHRRRRRLQRQRRRRARRRGARAGRLEAGVQRAPGRGRRSGRARTARRR